LGNERKFDPVDERNKNQSKKQNEFFTFVMSWPRLVPAAAVIQAGQRNWSLMGLKCDKMVKWCISITRVILEEIRRITNGGMKSYDNSENAKCDNTLLKYNWHWFTKVWGAKQIRYLNSPHPKFWMLIKFTLR
jgi:hypothetical protein